MCSSIYVCCVTVLVMQLKNIFVCICSPHNLMGRIDFGVCIIRNLKVLSRIIYTQIDENELR